MQLKRRARWNGIFPCLRGNLESFDEIRSNISLGKLRSSYFNSWSNGGIIRRTSLSDRCREDSSSKWVLQHVKGIDRFLSRK